MLASLRHIARLLRTACVLAHYDALVPKELADQLPATIRFAAAIAKWVPIKLDDKTNAKSDEALGQRLAAALTSLGPTYIKLGQFLATRPDIIGETLADDLKQLQDRLPPFSPNQARQTIEAELGQKLEEVYSDFGAPVAAASIAQVHKAQIIESADGITGEKKVAVKILRPNIESTFAEELETFAFAARQLERWQPDSRRLEPVKVIETLRESVALELDLRLEAAAASEMAERNADRKHFRVPKIDWPRTSQRVLTSEWIDAIPLGNLASATDLNIDRPRLAEIVVQTFLEHALEDGFFHADMHQGNLFVDDQGRLVAIDFGIMGRLEKNTRQYLAEILFGFLTQDYDRLAQVHFDAGYIARDKSHDAFAQALRSVGEPIFGREASEISMARLLTQLFQVTDVFDMTLQPQLVLLQKTMVVVEGVARDVDPNLNMWDASRPVVERWMTTHFSPEARIKDAAEAARALAPVIGKLPETLRTAQAVTEMMSNDGLKLHPETAKAIAMEKSRQNRPLKIAAWIGAAALVVIAASQL